MASALPRIIGSGSVKTNSRFEKSLKELNKVNPRERYVCIFPSSHNVFSGMGLNLLNNKQAEEVYEKASELVKFSVLKLCLGETESRLMSSLEKRDIAAYVTSHAALAKLTAERSHDIDHCKTSAGVGVGLINSLVFSGSITFEDGLDLVQRQAQAVDRVTQVIPTATLIVKMKPATNKYKVCKAVTEFCLRKGLPADLSICSIVEQIRPQLIKIGAHELGIQYLEKEGYRLFDFYSMSRDNKVPHAYNSQLMEPATRFISHYIDQKLRENPDYIRDPMIGSVHSGTSGLRLRFKKSVMKDLSCYPSKPILTEQLMHNIFTRSQKMDQPNTFVFWDRFLFKNLLRINRKAFVHASLVRA